ncbi:MAG TPA: hypothetical protein V6C58_25150 [Allocoleopsis sp.]
MMLRAHCQEEYKKEGKKPDSSELSHRLTQLKKTEEKKWLGEVSSVPLQQSLQDLEQAYKNFFASCKGKRKGKKETINNEKIYHLKVLGLATD